MFPSEMLLCGGRDAKGWREDSHSFPATRKTNLQAARDNCVYRASFFRLAFRSCPAGQVLRFNERKESENVDDTSGRGVGA